jgi:hypothetical protein
MRWMEHIARTEELKIRTKFKSENLKGRDLLQHLAVDGRIIF